MNELTLENAAHIVFHCMEKQNSNLLTAYESTCEVLDMDFTFEEIKNYLFNNSATH